MIAAPSEDLQGVLRNDDVEPSSQGYLFFTGGYYAAGRDCPHGGKVDQTLDIRGIQVPLARGR